MQGFWNYVTDPSLWKFLWVMVDITLIQTGIIWVLAVFYAVLFVVMWKDRKGKNQPYKLK